MMPRPRSVRWVAQKTVVGHFRPCPPRAAFPPPWTVEENNDACFIVHDTTGQALGYFYFEDEPGRRFAAKLLTRDEARRLPKSFVRMYGVTPEQG